MCIRDREIANFCYETKRPKDLPGMIETALYNNHTRLDAVKEYQKKMLYKLDGKAAERARDTILSRLS